MDDRLNPLEQEIVALKNRNKHVETEKAWEQSWVRTGSIITITYLAAVGMLYSIGNENPVRNALIPPVGFLLSTLSLPVLKKFWIERHRS
jgi:hypothetical protein